MGVRLYVRVQDPTGAFVDNGYGEPLARASSRLERLIRKKGVKPLMAFYVPHAEEMEGDDVEEWFDPADGLVVIEAMLRAAEEFKDELREYERVREDLDDFRTALQQAASLGKRWNLAMDT